MTADARNISFDNLSARLEVPQTEDELERLAETWNAMLARIEASVDRMTRFTADASHELRTPLALIRTTAEVALRRMRTPEAYRESLEHVRGEAERMTQLIEDLLFLARADAKATTGMPEVVDLPTQLDLAVAEASPLATAKGVTIHTTRAAPVAPIWGDDDAIRRMIFALLDNAVKYTPVGGTITACVRLEDERARVLIRDTGVGISPQALPHVFERFFRADPSRRRDGSSYGLGLAIAQTIAQQHHTAIEVQSEPENTVFSVGFEVAGVRKA